MSDKQSKADFEIIKKDSPHDKNEWLKILVKVRNNETGEIRDCQTTGLYDHKLDEFSNYIWAEGNYACDCNRDSFFNGGDSDMECGDTKYSINIYNPKTGVKIYEEFK